MGRLQAEGLATFLAIEMGMHVVDGAIVLTAMAIRAAHGILEHPGTIVNSMNEMMCQEEGDGAVDGRFIHRIQFIFQALQRESVIVSHHRAQQQDAHRRGLHVVRFQAFNIFRFVLHQYPGFWALPLAVSVSPGMGNTRV